MALAMLQLKNTSECTSQSVMREALVGDKLVSSLRFNPSTSAGHALHILSHDSQICTFSSGHGCDCSICMATILAMLVQSCCNIIKSSYNIMLGASGSEPYHLPLVSTFRLEASMH